MHRNGLDRNAPQWKAALSLSTEGRFKEFASLRQYQDGVRFALLRWYFVVMGILLGGASKLIGSDIAGPDTDLLFGRVAFALALLIVPLFVVEHAAYARFRQVVSRVIKRGRDPGCTEIDRPWLDNRLWRSGWHHFLAMEFLGTVLLMILVAVSPLALAVRAHGGSAPAVWVFLLLSLLAVAGLAAAAQVLVGWREEKVDSSRLRFLTLPGILALAGISVIVASKSATLGPAYGVQSMVDCRATVQSLGIGAGLEIRTSKVLSDRSEPCASRLPLRISRSQWDLIQDRETGSIACVRWRAQDPGGPGRRFVDGVEVWTTRTDQLPQDRQVTSQRSHRSGRGSWVEPRDSSPSTRVEAPQRTPPTDAPLPPHVRITVMPADNLPTDSTDPYCGAKDPEVVDNPSPPTSQAESAG